MAEQSKKLTLYFFLLGLFIMLAFFIGINIYNTYKSGTRSSAETTKSALECSFTFSLSTIRYSLPELSFKLRASDVNIFKTLVIDVDGIQTEVPLSEFFDYEQTVMIDDIIIEDSFIVYPKGCRGYNAKKCSLSSRECSTVNL